MMKLEIGYRSAFEIRKEKVCIKGCTPFTVMFLSDLHLTGSGARLVADIKDQINALDPTIVLLGGDYADTRAGLQLLKSLLSFLSTRAHVYAIPGNHDRFTGLKKLEALFTDNNITSLHRKSTSILINEQEISISGENGVMATPDPNCSILFTHQPADIEPLMYNIAFAGHLHGCQFVLWQTSKGLFPGRLFYKWNILKMIVDHCHVFISKGLGDTLPVRYNCKKDFIFVSVGNEVDL